MTSAAEDQGFVSLAAKHDFTAAHLGMLLGMVQENLQGDSMMCDLYRIEPRNVQKHNLTFTFARGMISTVIKATANVLFTIDA